MSSVPRICLVTDDPPQESPDCRLGEVLAAAGWDVQLLVCGPAHPTAAPGVRVAHLDDFPESAAESVPDWASAADRRSLRVLSALERMHATAPFDLIRYPDDGALGYRTAQAVQAGAALSGAHLVAWARGPSAWKHAEGTGTMTGPHDAILAFAEQTSFELAHFRCARSEYLLGEVRLLGWDASTAAVVPDCPPAVQPPVRVGPVDEVVFVGPLNKLHGLRLFVRGVAAVPDVARVGLVGTDPDLDGAPASEWVKERLPGRRVSVRVLDEWRPEEWAGVIDHVRGGNRLVVVPYLAATNSDFIRRLAACGVPFLAADYGPAAELVADPLVRPHVVFPPRPDGLARVLGAYLAAPAERRQEWTDRLAAAYSADAAGTAVRAFYDAALTAARAARAVPPAPLPRPTVTVGITHYNLGKYLPATLESVAAQTYPHLEVVIADDGSNDPASVAVLEEMERKYPTFRFLRGPNLGVCGNRNRCLDAATGELFFPLDADNIAAPDMIERLVHALVRQPADVAAASGFFLSFSDPADLAAGKYAGAYRPTGGPRTVNGLWNTYGETSGLFRTAVLRELGGYEDLHPEYVSEDWHLYVKLVARGWKVVMIPKPLYYYRVRADSRYRTGDLTVNHLRVVPAVAATPFTAAEMVVVWTLMAGLIRQSEELNKHFTQLLAHRDELHTMLLLPRHRFANRVANVLLHALNLIRRPVRAVLRPRKTLERVRGLLSRVGTPRLPAAR